MARSTRIYVVAARIDQTDEHSSGFSQVIRAFTVKYECKNFLKRLPEGYVETLDVINISDGDKPGAGFTMNAKEFING